MKCGIIKNLINLFNHLHQILINLHYLISEFLLISTNHINCVFNKQNIEQETQDKHQLFYHEVLTILFDVIRTLVRQSLAFRE